jgi:hypothetical protein
MASTHVVWAMLQRHLDATAFPRAHDPNSLMDTLQDLLAYFHGLCLLPLDAPKGAKGWPPGNAHSSASRSSAQ